MVSRMEKYHLSNNSETKTRRSEKNSHLYEELYTNKVYTEFTDIENNVVDLKEITSAINVNKREDYHKNKMLNQENQSFRRKTLLEETKEQDIFLEDQNYNINDVLENARKNRNELDEEEKKRHIKTVEYNILSDLSQEKEKQEKNKKLSKSEEENLEELIHTITSNSLRKKIDDELLDELMPSDDSESIISEDLMKQIEDVKDNFEEEYVKETTEEQEAMDQSFYTRSMDLSEEDFEFDEDEEDRSFIEDKKPNKFGKVLVILLILFILIVIGYIISIII